MFADKFEQKLLSYIYHIGNKTYNDVGRCGAISNVYNMTLIAMCDKIFTPWVSILLRYRFLSVNNPPV